MRVLVTGGSSMIGIALARALAARGDEVRCYQRRTVEPLTGEPSIDQVLGDVRDADAVARAAGGCDGIVHLAAKVGVLGEWEEYRSVNVDGTGNVLSAARAAGASRLVHVSSPSVAHGGEPIVGGSAGEPVLGRRRAWYPESKAIAEQRALGESDRDLGVVAVRPHLVWGPGDAQLVGRIVARARDGRLALVGGGQALVDTTHVDNAVTALIAAFDSVSPGARCSGRAYVIANGEPRPIRELVEGICRAAGVPFEPSDVPLAAAARIGAVVERLWPYLGRGDEPPLTRFVAEQLGTAHWFDPRPARDDLGWAPTVTIDEGLVRLAAWFSEQTG